MTKEAPNIRFAYIGFEAYHGCRHPDILIHQPAHKTTRILITDTHACWFPDGTYFALYPAHLNLNYINKDGSPLKICQYNEMFEHHITNLEYVFDDDGLLDFEQMIRNNPVIE